MHQAGRTKAGKTTKIVPIIALIVVALIAIGCFSYIRSAKSEMSSLDRDTYQAVFLTNGQVYFGKLKDIDAQHANLEDIYYLQSGQGEEKNNADKLKESESRGDDIKLIKLGNELHGPQDQMMIAKPQLLFWENLKDNSKVIQAINQYQKSNKQD